MNIERISEGKYRLVKDITGINGSRVEIKDFHNEEEALKECENQVKFNKSDYNFFIEEYVSYFPSSHHDKNGNPLVSKKTWVRHKNFT